MSRKEAGLSKSMSGLSLSSAASDDSTLTGTSAVTKLSRSEERQMKAAAREAKKQAKKEEENKEKNIKNALASAGKEEFGEGSKEAMNALARRATGILASEKRSRDIKIISFSLHLHSNILVEDTTIELNYGQRYGLIGRNGCGKSSFLQSLAAREVPIPDHIDTYLLREEAQPSELSALEYVIDSAKKEVARLEVLGEDILASEGPDSEVLLDIYDRQTELDPSTFESRASTILIGLGFDPVTIHKKTKDMSGGWRMRVALARALFIAPSMLLLDEPTNHLDLEACVWLEDYLSRYTKILIVVSHSQDFLNGVCTNMMVMQNRKLRYWGGNYDMYLKTRSEQDSAQLKEFKKQQEFIQHTKEFIASCGTYANLVRQAKSRQKILDKMYEEGLIQEPFVDPSFKFSFPPTVKLPPPLISFSDVAFSYSGKKEDYLFTNLNFGIDSDCRIALVGPNGAGKSTLLKLMVGENQACEGSVSTRPGISIGRYHQHSAEVLEEDLSPCEYMQKKFANKIGEKKLEEWRSMVGQWGIPSEFHLQPIKCLSDGLKMRLVFCEIAYTNPHILLLDEPTNAADMDMIDSLAEAIKKFQGGVVVISHDFRLLSQIAEEIWVVDHGIKKWDGDIRSYKAYLKAKQSKK
jgi:ATP-binding cassette, subfamily F, member 2